MSRHTLKSVTQRGSLFAAAFTLVVATLASPLAFADALNPLTERSLLLSSSAPGYQNTDGAGNSETNLNAINEYYAEPGTGPNGQKTGETFTFRVSTDSVATSRPIKAFTLQYCTTAAGYCQSPGNNTGDAREFVYDPLGANDEEDDPDTWTGAGPDNREANIDAFEHKRSDLDVVYPTPSAGTHFQVWSGGVNVSAGWSMSTSNVEDALHSGALTGKNNFITLTHEDGISPVANDQIRIVFLASTSHYITNPGSGAFFVKINTYDSDDTDDHFPAVPILDNTNIIDGGVTVANVMTDSIHITTKVLETMAFSVGTHNRDTDELVSPATHGTCDAIQALNGNRLQLGNPDAEYSLETTRAWDVHSYWRLSSNSSAGATVYYSGDTLRNTVGDHITEIGAVAALSNPGTEQFGISLVDPSAHSSTFADLITTQPTRYFAPSITPLVGSANYIGGNGLINVVDNDPDPDDPIDASFAFLSSSAHTPVILAENDNSVLSCATARVRYVANIGADTPAGVYTTKINYLAAPKY
jgi:hypothetical protein